MLSNMFRIGFLLVLILMIIPAGAGCSKSPNLKGTTWVSEDGSTRLEFKTETIVIRDYDAVGEYKIEGNIVTIGNAFIKIPLTYEDGKLTGRLYDGREDVVLTRKK